jgi:hypothetical protein
MNLDFTDINHKKESFDKDIFYYAVPYGDGKMSGYKTPTVFKSVEDAPDVYRTREVLYLPSLSSETGPRKVIFNYRQGYYHQWLELFSSILNEIEKTDLAPTEWIGHIVTPENWTTPYEKETLEFFCDKILEQFGVSIVPTYTGPMEWRSRELVALTNADVVYNVEENVSTYQRLRKFIQNFPETSERVEGKIAYLLRKTNQRVNDEYKIADFFRESGVEVVSSEDFKSIKHQIEYFSKLSCLITPTGSGLVNMMYMKENTTVVELVTPLELEQIDYIEETDEEVTTVIKDFHNHYSGLAFASNITYVGMPHDREPDTVLLKVQSFNPFNR